MLSRYLDLDILHIVQTSSGSCCNRICSTLILILMPMATMMIKNMFKIDIRDNDDGYDADGDNDDANVWTFMMIMMMTTLTFMMLMWNTIEWNQPEPCRWPESDHTWTARPQPVHHIITHLSQFVWIFVAMNLTNISSPPWPSSLSPSPPGRSSPGPDPGSRRRWQGRRWGGCSSQTRWGRWSRCSRPVIKRW